MITLHLRTDSPQAYVGVFNGEQCIASRTWQAHRELAESLFTVMRDVLKECLLEWADLQGIVIYEGPGSFTGLRIGIATANGLAAGLGVPVCARGGDAWQQSGIAALHSGQADAVALPRYGSDPHITLPKK